MTFYPSGWDTPFEQYSTKVTVEAGKKTYVVGRLPWRKGRELASWTPRALVGRRYGRLQTALQPGTIFCAIQADDKAIRVVWDNQADIWSAVSTDGKTFSLPRKLPIPVSTGWREGSVRFWRDESGRFMLTFRSDRDRRHVGLLYVSWSRDFVHWSAPVAMLDQRVDQYDVFQDDRGRFILAVVDRGGGYTVKTTSEKNEQNIIIFASRDAYRWEKLVTIPEHRFRWTREIQMLQRDDGKYELFVVKRPVLHNEPFMGGPDGKTPMLRITRSDGTSEARKVPHPEDWEPERIWRWEAEGNTEVWRFLSNDAKTWDQGVRITSLGGGGATAISAAHVRGRTLLAFSEWSREGSSVITFYQSAAGDWRQSRGVVQDPPSTAYHPRWGYMIAWKAGITTGSSGPYFMRRAVPTAARKKRRTK